MGTQGEQAAGTSGALRRLTVTHWLRLVKFSHTLFALPFALVATVWSLRMGGEMTWAPVGVVLLCMVFARNTAMGYNRVLDRRIDALNPRTAGREIPSGQIGVRAAKWFVALNAVLFVLAAGLANRTALYLSPIALVLLLGYSHTKHYTMLCHFWLGLTLALAPLGASVAVRGAFGWAETLLGLGILFWVAGFDIVYALQDETFDREQQLHSVPSRLGRRRAILVARICHVLAPLAFAVAVWRMGLPAWGWAPLGLFAAILAFQHTRFSAEDIRRVGPSFMLLNGVNSLLFAAGLIIAIFFK